MPAGEPIGSFEVAQETGNFGSLPAIGSAQIPDDSLFTPTRIPVHRARTLLGPAEEPSLKLPYERSDAWSIPDEPETVYALGAPLARRTGTVDLETEVRSPVVGGNFTSWATHPLGWLLSSGLEGFAPPGASTDAVAGAAISANEHLFTAAPNFRVGQVVCVDIDGRREWSAVVDVTALTVRVSPAWSRALSLADGDVVRICHTWVPALNGIGTVGPSVKVVRARIGRRVVHYGCRLQRLRLHTDKTRRSLLAEITLLASYIRPEGVAGFGFPTVDKDGTSAKFLGSFIVISGALNRTTAIVGTPETLSRGLLDVEPGWSVTIENTLSPLENADTVLGAEEIEVSDTMITAEVRSAPNPTLDTMYRLRSERQLVLGCGPASGAGGAGIILQSAHLTGMSERDDTQPRLIQPATFRPGHWEFETLAGGRPAGTPFRLGMPLP